MMEEEEQQVKEENLLHFLDSVDGYLTVLDSLSSTLRQGWLELASARHSMGASRINGVLLDLKVHSADTSLQVSRYDGDFKHAGPETLVEIANMRSTLLSTFDRVHKELEDSKG